MSFQTNIAANLLRRRDIAIFAIKALTFAVPTWPLLVTLLPESRGLASVGEYPYESWVLDDMGLADHMRRQVLVDSLGEGLPAQPHIAQAVGGKATHWVWCH